MAEDANCNFKPDNYQVTEVKPDTRAAFPEGSAFFCLHTESTKAFLVAYQTGRTPTMGLKPPQEVVSYLHENMTESQGIIEVGCGETLKGNTVLYYIIKDQLHDDGRPGNKYCLKLNLQVEDTIYSIAGHFSEEGTTGIRDNAVFAMYMRDHPELEDPFEGWSRDPYDSTYTKGFLMNQSEIYQFDKYFPEHPLSQARKYVDYIATNN